MYSLLKILLYYFFTVFFRFKIIGAEHIPATGGVIIAANHISLWDPPVIAAACTRSINFMAKEELFAVGIFNWLITTLKAFPVRRGTADRAAIRYAINLLKNGEILGAFPEGTRSISGELGQPEPGIAMIALKAGVPIIPVGITGTNKVFKHGCIFPQFIVRFGKPIMISEERADKQVLETFSHTLMKEISCLLQER